MITFWDSVFYTAQLACNPGLPVSASWVWHHVPTQPFHTFLVAFLKDKSAGFLWVLFLFTFESGSYYVAQAGFTIMHAGQVLCHWFTPPVVLVSLCSPDWPQIKNPLASASQVLACDTMPGPQRLSFKFQWGLNINSLDPGIELKLFRFGGKYLYPMIHPVYPFINFFFFSLYFLCSKENFAYSRPQRFLPTFLGGWSFIILNFSFSDLLIFWHMIQGSMFPFSIWMLLSESHVEKTILPSLFPSNLWR